jgi:hypothetical protein
LDCASRSQPLAVWACASSTRCFEAYKLMSQTKHADAWTLFQLQSREKSDALATAMLEVHTPLTCWLDKISAALIACEQTHAMTREGLLLGPVDPRVTAHIATRKRAASTRPGGSGPGPPSGGRGRQSSGRGGGTGGGSNSRRPPVPPFDKRTSAGDSKTSAAKKKRKRPSAGSGAAAEAAGTGS